MREKTLRVERHIKMYDCNKRESRSRESYKSFRSTIECYDNKKTLMSIYYVLVMSQKNARHYVTRV